MGHYCVETKKGKVEVSKGAYLTILKRKTTTKKTPTKTKLIYHLKEAKKTVKPEQMNERVRRSARLNNIVMKDRKNNSHVFTISNDHYMFKHLPPLPSIPMDFDNDNESEWEEI